MKIMSMYKVKICATHGAFKIRVEKYRMATDFFIKILLDDWEYISKIQSQFSKLREIELLTHKTASNTNPKYIILNIILRKIFTNFQVIYEEPQ